MYKRIALLMVLSAGALANAGCTPPKCILGDCGEDDSDTMDGTAGTPSDVGEAVATVWQAGVDSFEPKTDFTNIYKFIRDRRGRNKKS